MSSISIQKKSITDLDVDAIVNAANEDLFAGGGVCGAIFRAAGYDRLEAACDAIGHCDTGCAVITPGFDLKARHIIHAVGPIWYGGDNGEARKLYGAYRRSLELALENGCRSVGFSLISAGIYGYPKSEAWKIAVLACRDFLRDKPDADMHIIFAVLDDHTLSVGLQTLEELAMEYKA